MFAYIALHDLKAQMVIAFIKISKEELVGDFPINHTSERKKVNVLLYFTYYFALTFTFDPPFLETRFQ